jgi:glycosyltransferase involved in cell wall biosynthesis
MINENLLAIVIPAYKATHLGRALECIAAQTDKRYIVYVGDDASPENVSGCVLNCSIPKERLVYKRFEENLGRSSLIKQWDRCVKLSSEPWVWLFSDDDEMDPDCVAAFHAALERTSGAYDLYRFNVRVIDDEDRFLDLCPPHPEIESVLDYTYFFVYGVRRITQQESIFRRNRYEEIGGVPDFPMAWYSDSAFAIRCAEKTGLFTISGPKVGFRLGGGNISSRADNSTVVRKWQALMDFCILAAGVFDRIPEGTCLPTRSRARVLLRERFFKGVQRPRRWIGKTQRLVFQQFLQSVFPESAKRDGRQFWRYNLELVTHRSRVLVRNLLR